MSLRATDALGNKSALSEIAITIAADGPSLLVGTWKRTACAASPGNFVGTDVHTKTNFESIRNYEQHLARSGTIVLKFWLNVSQEEQRERFLARLDEPEKNWKFAPRDVHERDHWDAYMHAYEEAIRETSREWAPWYVIPADDKRYARVCVADIIVRTLKQLKLEYPRLRAEDELRITEMRGLLEK